jgi:hypothetical protein
VRKIEAAPSLFFFPALFFLEESSNVLILGVWRIEAQGRPARPFANAKRVLERHRVVSVSLTELRRHKQSIGTSLRNLTSRMTVYVTTVRS